MKTRILSLVSLLAFVLPLHADPDAKELARKLSAVREDGSSFVRLKMEVQQPAGTLKSAYQIQIKQRQSKGATELVYQILFPKERKGESVLLRQAGGKAPSGAHFVPPDQVKTLGSSDMSERLFGSDLSYQDVIEDFYSWENQAIVGKEKIGKTNCYILESKPGGADRSSYGSVRSWIDTDRPVPMRVEKLSPSGQVVVRIDTTRVVADDKGRQLPGNLKVQRGGGSLTDIDGSKIRHDVSFSDAEFTSEGLKQLSTPKSVE